jgi:D-lyxose ketol-isomerase
MKPEINAVLAEVKANLANPKPAMPNFTAMSIMEATKWCVANGIIANADIVRTTGKSTNTVSTALWKLRNPKRVKAIYRRAKKVKALKAGLDLAKPIIVKKPKVTNGKYDDGMETPYTDSVRRTRFNFLDEERQPLHELVAENRRLKILIDHYESLLFKGDK